MKNENWTPVDHGAAGRTRPRSKDPFLRKSFNQKKGCKVGYIVKDEEYRFGDARINMEKNVTVYGKKGRFAITAGIDVLFLYTVFLDTEEEASDLYEKMKFDLQEIAEEEDNDRQFELWDEFEEKYQR